MKNFSNKQAIFTVFMSVAAVASASASEQTYSQVPPIVQIVVREAAVNNTPSPLAVREAAADNTPSPRNPTQNGMTPEEREDSIGRVAPCNSPVAIDFVSFARILNSSPEAKSDQIEQKEQEARSKITNKYYSGYNQINQQVDLLYYEKLIALALSVEQLDNRYAIIANEIAARKTLTT